MVAGRRCFVTVGATASFLALLQEVLSEAFLDALGAHGFDELIVQTGPDHAWALQQIEHLGKNDQERETDDSSAPKSSSRWPVIQVVSYTTSMTALMLPCRGDSLQKRPVGAMISHAGSGSILDAVRIDVPLIVVANRALLGNHQEELAQAVEAAGWAVKGELGCLEDAIERLGKRLVDEQLACGLSSYQEPPFPTVEDERSGLFDWTAIYAGEAPSATTAAGTAHADLLQLD